MKKVVLELDLHDDKDKQKAMEAVSSISGVDSIAMDMKERKLTVIGDIDPVTVVDKLKKGFHAKILTVGPAKEEKKDEAKKDDGKKNEGAKKDEKKDEGKKDDEKKNEGATKDEKKDEGKKDDGKKNEGAKKDDHKKGRKEKIAELVKGLFTWLEF